MSKEVCTNCKGDLYNGEHTLGVCLCCRFDTQVDHYRLEGDTYTDKSRDWAQLNGLERDSWRASFRRHCNCRVNNPAPLSVRVKHLDAWKPTEDDDAYTIFDAALKIYNEPAFCGVPREVAAVSAAKELLDLSRAKAKADKVEDSE